MSHSSMLLGRSPMNLTWETVHALNAYQQWGAGHSACLLVTAYDIVANETCYCIEAA